MLYNVLDYSHVLIATIQGQPATVAVDVYINFGHYYGVYAVEVK